MITDGQPEGESPDVIEKATDRIHAGDSRPSENKDGKSKKGRKQFIFFAVGVQNANMMRLSEISVRVPQRLKGQRDIDIKRRRI